MVAKIDQIVVNALSRAADEFRPDELAYYAATTKVELPFKDRLAFQLHRQLEPQGYLVAREWKRIDIAIFDPQGEPAAFIELKAMYTFDAVKNAKHYTDLTLADEVKAAARAAPATAVYSLLLAAHQGGRVEPQFAEVVKYHAGINDALVTLTGPDQVRARAAMRVLENLRSRNLVATDAVIGGRAFGMDISVLYWLVRAGPTATAI